MVARTSIPLKAALSRAQVRALTGPARQEIVDVLETAGPCPVARLARLLGRPADALYHHLRLLVKVGLVKETERRKQGRNVFVVYDLAIRPLNLVYAGPATARDLTRVVAGAQRLTWREFERALSRGEGEIAGPGRTLWGARAKGWMTPPQLARVNALLAQLLAEVRAGRPVRGAVPVSVSFVLAPSPAPRRAPGPNP